MYFPTICVDNFFEDPDKVRNFALAQEYKPCRASDEKTTWPGVRTEALHIIEPMLHANLVSKIFALFGYDKNNLPLTGLLAGFHKFPKDEQTCSVNPFGWVHRDVCPLAGLIYLTPDYDISCGTSLYKLKSNTFYNHMPEETNKAFKEYHLDFKKEKESYYNEKRIEHNSHFVETATIGNVYNRLVAYDGNQPHSLKRMTSDEDDRERLTLVFFVYDFRTFECPIPRMRAF